jgi:hypothetical protein
MEYDAKFTELSQLFNINSLIITLNNNIVTVPFVASGGDVLKFLITKLNLFFSQYL